MQALEEGAGAVREALDEAEAEVEDRELAGDRGGGGAAGLALEQAVGEQAELVVAAGG
jgi:hypothetical protein